MFYALFLIFSAPNVFAQVDTLVSSYPLLEPISLSFSSIFSQILGTAINSVGRAHYKL
jgi:hypothetical protein